LASSFHSTTWVAARQNGTPKWIKWQSFPTGTYSNF
jgi:hypothetical protein